MSKPETTPAAPPGGEAPAPLTPAEREELRDLLGRATPGPWWLWKGCSWRRFGSAETGRTVCEPTVHPRDGHPDLHFNNGGQDGPDATLMAGAPVLARRLLATVEAQAREVDRLRDALEFYADESNYEYHAVGAPWDDCPAEMPVSEDHGETAREALKPPTGTAEAAPQPASTPVLIDQEAVEPSQGESHA